MRILLTCWLLLNALALQAQPGGGGGIGFQHLYWRVGSQLIPVSWEAAQARMFYLAPSGKQPVSPHTPIWIEDYSPNFKGLYARAGIRLLLIHQADTMMLDLTHLLGPNGAGTVHLLDSLVIMPGYFCYDDSLRNKFDPAGITPHSVSGLLTHRLLKYQRRTDFGFLSPRRLGADYYLALARHQLTKQQPESVLVSLNAAEARQPILRNRSITASLRASAYRQLGQYEAAIHWATQTLKAVRQLRFSGESRSDGTPDYDSYNSYADAYCQRQHLYLLQRNYPLALADYDSLSSLFGKTFSGISDDASQLNRNISRSFFLADSLHQPAAYLDAIRLLRELLRPQQKAPAWPCDRQLHTQISYYAEDNATNDFFRLGTAEYRAGQYTDAFKHWYRALAGGQSQRGGAAYVTHYDSVLQQHPRQPFLLLGRAIAYLSCDYVKWPNTAATQQKCFENALTDLDRAESLGYAAADVPYYRALIFRRQERWPEMRRELDAAIIKMPTAGELYLLRFRARVALREASADSYLTDPDWLNYQRLCPGFR